MSGEDEKKAVTLSSAVVRCICVLASFVVLACALLGLGVACVAIEKFSSDSAPCPNNLELVVFATAGGLLCFSVLLLCLIRRKKKRIRVRDLEERLLSNAAAPPPTPADNRDDSVLQVNDAINTNGRLEDPVAEVSSPDEVNDFAMTQKSADVIQWVEQQQPKPMSDESFPLDAPDGAAIGDSDTGSSDVEITAL